MRRPPGLFPTYGSQGLGTKAALATQRWSNPNDNMTRRWLRWHLAQLLDRPFSSTVICLQPISRRDHIVLCPRKISPVEFECHAKRFAPIRWNSDAEKRSVAMSDSASM